MGLFPPAPSVSPGSDTAWEGSTCVFSVSVTKTSRVYFGFCFEGMPQDDQGRHGGEHEAVGNIVPSQEEERDEPVARLAFFVSSPDPSP